jgi:putative DNA primase/helicase
LFIFADNDASGTGQKAASDLASRARAAGIRCMTLTPTDTGTDWADAWARREAVTVTTTHESTP